MIGVEPAQARNALISKSFWGAILVDSRKRAVNIFDMCAVLLMLYYMWSFSVYWLPHSALISQLGVFFGFAFLLFFVVKAISAYILFSHDVMRVYPRAMLRALVGLAVFLFVIIYKLDFLSEKRSSSVILGALVAWFVIRGWHFSAWFYDRFPVSDDEARQLMSIFPPRTFHDMWPMHLFMIGLLVILPNLANVYWSFI